MTIELEAALTVLRGRVEDTLSSPPPSAAERRNPENGVAVPMGALDVVLAALSSPRADDVREALAMKVAVAARVSRDAGRIIADAILSDPRFEVRPRGTVTDAEEELSRLEQITGKVEASRGQVTAAEVEVEVEAAAQAIRTRRFMSMWPHTGAPMWTDRELAEAALEAARGARVSAENTTPTNHTIGSSHG